VRILAIALIHTESRKEHVRSKDAKDGVYNLLYDMMMMLWGCFHFKYLYLVVPLEIFLSKYFRMAVDPIVIL